MTFGGSYMNNQSLIIKRGSKSVNIENLLDFGSSDINFTSLALFLRLGFIPSPYSTFKNVDRLVFEEQDISDITSIERAFTYFNTKLTTSKEFVLSEFRENLISAVNSQIEKDKKYLLMLSGGKDSTAILFALKRLGLERQVVCATFVAGVKEDESIDAENLCKSLGFRHTTIKSCVEEEFHLYSDMLKKSPLLAADFATPAYVRAVVEARKMFDFDAVIDGMGNDIYMGHVPAKLETNLQKLSLAKRFSSLWGRFNAITGNDKISYGLQSLQMLPVERCFSGSRLSFSAIQKIGLPIIEAKKYIKDLNSMYSNYDIYDGRSLTRGVLYDNLCCCEKGRAAALYQNVDIVFPFCNDAFSSYYWSLEQKSKFDPDNRINKVSLRSYLMSEFDFYGISYNEYCEKKGSFRYDFPSFVNVNIDEIVKEVKLCDVKFNMNFYEYIDKNRLKLSDYTLQSQIFLIYSMCCWLNGR